MHTTTSTALERCSGHLRCCDPAIHAHSSSPAAQTIYVHARLCTATAIPERSVIPGTGSGLWTEHNHDLLLLTIIYFFINHVYTAAVLLPLNFLAAHQRYRTNDLTVQAGRSLRQHSSFINTVRPTTKQRHNPIAYHCQHSSLQLFMHCSICILSFAHMHSIKNVKRYTLYLILVVVLEDFNLLLQSFLYTVSYLAVKNFLYITGNAATTK